MDECKYCKKPVVRIYSNTELMCSECYYIYIKKKVKCKKVKCKK